AGQATSTETRRAVETSGPPSIPGRSGLAQALARLGASGVLAVRDVDCRRFFLRLPDLHWTASETLSGSACSVAPGVAVDPRFGLAAVEIGPNTVEVSSETWRYGFRGSSPAFTPDGTLTFVRAGRVYEWTVRCPAGAETVTFEGLRSLERCARPLDGVPPGVHELVWLGDDDYAAVVGPEGAASVVVVRDGRRLTLFTGVGSRIGALQPSPGGTYLAARIDTALALFRTDAPGTRALPFGTGIVRGISWSPDERLAAIATDSQLHVFRVEDPRHAVVLPVSAAAIRWR
ncbi:MAG TPA: WD40 repeat domain-containing protein, partial [Gaiellaceae bacterium]|nr:WD40 repeat domain-containing protein [Gaiellaceae bacterium]